MGVDATGRRPEERALPLTVRVVVDNPALGDKTFDYAVPDRIGDVTVGTMVRVDLAGRHLAGWVVADDVDPPAGVTVRPLRRVSGLGPAAEVVDLATWAAWRWAGQPAHFLGTASPPAMVQGLPPAGSPPPAPSTSDPLAAAALRVPRSIVRLPPAADPLSLVREAARLGTTLVVAPSVAAAEALHRRLRSDGVAAALVPREWARAAAGAPVVIGARSAAWAPAPDLAAVVVLDEHDEAHRGEASPTWSARDVAAERAARADVPCTFTSPCPSLEALDWGRLVLPTRGEERAGWPVVEVVDRRGEEPARAGLWSPALVRAVRGGGRVVAVLNRKGRARLLACATDGELARCEVCDAAVALDDEGLVCGRCATRRPALCLHCGSGRLKLLRIGVARAREELQRLAGVAVAEVTGDTGELPDAPVLIGTEAVLHRSKGADLVAFLDLDSELLAPRFRAAEQAMALVARAARLVGGRDGGGRLLLQTRLPDAEVVRAAVHADPAGVSDAERPRRVALRLPPTTAVATVSGAAAEAYAVALRAAGEVEVLGPREATWLVKAPDHQILCDALAATPRPPGRLRVAVDPPRL